jgi:hypothetical protein
MIRRSLLIVFPAFLLRACLPKALPPVPVAPASKTISYVEDVQPVFNTRCAVCHSCYNAACQVKLTSYEGLDRGGTKALVYDGERLKNVPPTRLFMDAHSTGEWREKGFHSVTANTAEGLNNDSLMMHLLAAKREEPVAAADYQPEAADLTCAADTAELGKFLRKHPDRGMPFGLPPLSDDEFETIASWLQQGALGPTAEEQAALTTPSPKAAKEIEKWEAFLNRDGPKHGMTARYIYEHYFLAHLSFRAAEPGEFYELVRSTTPPGEPISVVATTRPYDPVPGGGRVYYRFRKIHSTIVYKTHMVVEFHDERLARFREQFIDTEWLEEPHMVDLDVKGGANPFLVYEQIPPRSRYQFLLDNSEYIIRTFIRGPVCKGQIALNVINDHFWVVFLDPEADQTVRHPEFLVGQADNLRLPNEKGSDEAVLSSFSNRYRKRYSDFYKAKSKLYDAEVPDGQGLDAIWKGRIASDAPILTVYRHFDSASVHKGVLGGLPKTMWAVDYPQLERIYYALVAGFDVYGNISHQLNVRRYMDYLRIEGELNFLSFMPRELRLPMLQSWYVGDGAFENVDHDNVKALRPTRVSYSTDDPKREFVERLVDDNFLRAADIDFDVINYSRTGTEVAMPAIFETDEDIRNGFRALTAPGTAFIRNLNDDQVNVLFVRIRDFKGEDRFFTIVVNRWHTNVNSLFREGSRMDPSKDTMDFIPGSVGAYPNYFFDFPGDRLDEFFDLMANYDGSPEYEAKLREYGVNRADPDFWQAYDFFQAQLDEADPLHAGLYDLNRYYSKAIPATD